MRKIANTPIVFNHFFQSVFDTPYKPGSLAPEWIPCVTNNHNVFIEFEPHFQSPLSTEIQLTESNLWGNIAAFDGAPNSDAKSSTVVYNLITDIKNETHRTIAFNCPHQGKEDTFSILCVTQVGLGALQQSDSPETKAWVEFLTRAHLHADIPSKTPDIVAEAKAIDLLSWRPEERKYYFQSLSRDQQLTSKDLDEMLVVIEFCLEKGYPISTMAKYTGLSLEEITKIVTALKDNSL